MKEDTQHAREAALIPTSSSHRLVRDGIAIDFEATPVGNTGNLTEGMFADIRFRLTNAETGQPMAGLAPGAWLDQALPDSDPGTRTLQCKSRVGLYLKGVMGARPLLDFNSYYLVLMNQDASITVIDPVTSLGGITSTLMRIPLKHRPMDWTASRGDRQLYVSLPASGEVALIDTETFQVVANLPAGSEPSRVVLQPDGRYLWVGNDSRQDGQSGVTVIDTQTRKTVLSAATGAGHHEIAFSEDSRYAFVSNRDAGTVSIFDVATLSRVSDLATGPKPLALDYSALSKAVYVADGKAGRITVIDARSLAVRKVIDTGRGIGPLRFTEDGRYGITLNTLTDQALVIDAASDEIIHQLQVSAEPYQLVYTRAYAYVRGLASPRVTMINLGSLGRGKEPILQSFEAGPQPPKLADDLPLADSVAAARDDAAVFVVNPVDNTAYFYMEGMNAPSSNYLNRGHTSRAARVIDRSLRETAPGVFSSRVRLPAAGDFDVALILNQPEITHCFRALVMENPELAKARQHARVEFLLDNPRVQTGEPVKARFRIVQGQDDEVRRGVRDLRVRYFRAPGSWPQEVAAYEVGEGVYEAAVTFDDTGAYYLHVGSRSLGMEFGSQPYASLRVQNSGVTPAHQIP
ncbi:beta-propeller fold lactonase family protein [Pseudomonas sp. UL073]|uniref:Beta-propeller fold lactonase family protein n=2 Tax=Zestomonas insulae TaxID=2809017 RepID=A0ABS2IAB9_9GAMM|nr:cytochrome D1 domain-containing protein [Pseudomonas insulae]MBM7059204.1 beta-propeller fold lactonase family protein [Pseudomonas insulae]